jgi:hypothetical protein
VDQPSSTQYAAATPYYEQFVYTQINPSCIWYHWTIQTGFCIPNRVPKATTLYLRTQGVQEHTRKTTKFCSTLFISQDAIFILMVWYCNGVHRLLRLSHYSFYSVYSPFIYFALCYITVLRFIRHVYTGLHPGSLQYNCNIIIPFSELQLSPFYKILHHCLLGEASALFILFRELMPTWWWLV